MRKSAIILTMLPIMALPAAAEARGRAPRYHGSLDPASYAERTQLYQPGYNYDPPDYNYELSPVAHRGPWAFDYFAFQAYNDN